MWKVNGYDDTAVKAICYNCDSPTAKQSYNYFRRMHFVTGGKVWSKVWSKKPVAFYYASRCRDHVRLIEIAVHKDYQGQGIGRMVLLDLLSATKRAGLHKLTFRTPINERAADFWLHMGATITGLKDEDYEMEINIK